jgi:2-amino-4-hydroxy-6-hydroxymethyldihydropteridine diphosphokinase
MNLIALGLGSNLGDRKQNLRSAIDLIVENDILAKQEISNIYETKAMLAPGAPKEWSIDYLNVVIKGQTSLSPESLLNECKKIEMTMGRGEDYPKWSPRIIDIDILAYGGLSLETDDLTIPHKGLLDREFAIIPLAEVWPDWLYPVPSSGYYGKSVSEIISKKV